MSGTEREQIVLPIPPEPVLSAEERAELSKLYADPAFWDWFVTQPEPSDEELAAYTSQRPASPLLLRLFQREGRHRPARGASVQY